MIDHDYSLHCAYRKCACACGLNLMYDGQRKYVLLDGWSNQKAEPKIGRKQKGCQHTILSPVIPPLVTS